MAHQVKGRLSVTFHQYDSDVGHAYEAGFNIFDVIATIGQAYFGKQLRGACMHNKPVLLRSFKLWIK
ncbi:hypothetical protein D3C71_2143340 [compost metagenome]